VSKVNLSGNKDLMKKTSC